MTILTLLIPIALAMGAIGLSAFFWSLRSGQYEDLSGDAARILFDEDAPLRPDRRRHSGPTEPKRPPHPATPATSKETTR